MSYRRPILSAVSPVSETASCKPCEAGSETATVDVERSYVSVLGHAFCGSVSIRFSDF
jgi:hypothetical protein